MEADKEAFKALRKVQRIVLKVKSQDQAYVDHTIDNVIKLRNRT